MMPENILLEPEQKRLLSRLVEADRNVPRAERRDFVIIRADDPTWVRHRALKGDLSVLLGDLDILQQERLISYSRYDNKGRPTSFYTTPLGKQFVEQLGKPMEYTTQQQQQRILGVIADFQTQHSNVFTSDTHVARALNMPLEDVRGYMELLKEAGLIKKSNTLDGHASAFLSCRSSRPRSRRRARQTSSKVNLSTTLSTKSARRLPRLRNLRRIRRRSYSISRQQRMLL